MNSNNIFYCVVYLYYQKYFRQCSNVQKSSMLPHHYRCCFPDTVCVQTQSFENRVLTQCCLHLFTALNSTLLFSCRLGKCGTWYDLSSVSVYQYSTLWNSELIAGVRFHWQVYHYLVGKECTGLPVVSPIAGTFMVPHISGWYPKPRVTKLGRFFRVPSTTFEEKWYCTEMNWTVFLCGNVALHHHQVAVILKRWHKDHWHRPRRLVREYHHPCALTDIRILKAEFISHALSNLMSRCLWPFLKENGSLCSKHNPATLLFLFVCVTHWLYPVMLTTSQRFPTASL